MWPVHWVRLLLELGGCIRRRQGAFRLTRKGRSLLDGPPAQLFALLFETNFRRFDLAYRFGAEWPELQIQVPFTLYRIWSLPAEWRTAPVLLRETVLQIPPPPEAASLAHLPALLFDSRIMKPLVDFGLIATRTEPRSREDHCLLRVSYRRTSLMRAFLHFEPSRL